MPYEINWEKEFGLVIGIESTEKGKKAAQVVMAVYKPLPYPRWT